MFFGGPPLGNVRALGPPENGMRGDLVSNRLTGVEIYEIRSKIRQFEKVKTGTQKIDELRNREVVIIVGSCRSYGML